MLLARLRSLIVRERRDCEIAEELQTHIEFEARKYIASGMPEKEAWRRASIVFGAKAQAVEECREQRGMPFLENLVRDCRYAFRVFRQSRAFALSVIFTIAIAVGANTTVFGFCKAMLLATLPVPNPQQLHFVSIDYPGSGSPPYPYFTFPDLQKMQQAVSAQAMLTGFTEAVDFHLRDDSGTTSTITGRLVTGNFFSALQVEPLAGRAFTERDNLSGGEAVAALSYRFWKRRFGSDTSVIGRRLLIQRQPVSVVAVMPQGFDGVEAGVQPDIWMPLSVQPAIGYGGYASFDKADWKKPWLQQEVYWLHVLARSPNDRHGLRLRAGLTAYVKAAVAAQLPRMSDPHDRAIMLSAKVKLTDAGRGLPRLRAKFSLPLQILLGLVIVLLFSGCVNIVNLLLARSRAHEHEAAIRAALGSSRGRLITAKVTETLLLVVAGGLVSFPLAVWGSQLILHWLVSNSGLQLEVSVDWSTLAFTAAITLIAGLLVSLLTALRTADVAVSKTLGQRGQINPAMSRHASRLSAALVAGQLGLSIASLVIAGLLTHTLLNYEHLDIGMDRQHVLSVAIDPSAAGYNSAAKLNAFYRQLTARIDEIPGVISNSLGGCGLMDNGCATVAATIRGAEKKKGDDSLVERNYVGAKYFSTVGMALLRGREITEHDTLHTMPVGVVNTQFERHFLRGSNAIGRTVHVEDRDIQIVGVVENARSDNIHKRALPYLYLPVEQAPEGWNVSHIEIRTRGNPESVTSSVRTAILGINRAIPVAEITTLSEETNRGLASELLVGRLAGVFSALILLVTAVGLYGILAYEVTQRRGELAVRLVLGATRAGVIRMIGLRAGLIWITGCAAGLAVSFSVGRLIASLLFETGTLDLWAYGGALFSLLLISAIAAWLPAWRAASVDPASVLRSE